MSDKKKTNKKKISTLVKQQVPQFVLEDHPKFAEFVNGSQHTRQSKKLNLCGTMKMQKML